MGVSWHLEKRYKSSWTIVLDLGRDATGKQKRIARSVKGTKKQAEQEAARLVGELLSGMYVAPSKATVGEYLEGWLASYCESSLAPSTLRSYTMIVKTHLVPALGVIPLQSLTSMHLQIYYADAVKGGNKREPGTGLKPRTVLHHHRLIREALSHAVKWGIIARNVADAVEPPREEKPELKVLTPKDAMAVAESLADPYRLVVITALWTGARQSEVLGLQWQDIGAAYLQVERALYKHPGQPYAFRQPKRGSRRRILIPQQLSALLEDVRKPSGLVFCRPDGQPLNPTVVSKRFSKAAAAYGHPGVRFHDLRHSHATLLMTSGGPARAVQERLGHQSVEITLGTYSHVSTALQENLVGMLEDSWGQIETEPRVIQ